MKRRPIPDSNLTSAALVALMRLSLAADGIDLGACDRIETAGPHASLSDKNLLAEHVLAQHGAAPLLRVGAMVHALAADPLGKAMLSAVDGANLIDRWQRLERYVHTRHPILVDAVTVTSARLRHPRAADERASPAMDVVLASVIAHLLIAVGCASLTLHIGRGKHRVCAIEEEELRLAGPLPPALATDVWQFRWVPTSPRADAPLEIKSLPHQATLIADITALFQKDLLQHWSLAALAHHLGLSMRTLQRRLAEAGCTLKSVRRAAQIEHATAMLHDTDHSLTTIGYACGFSDSAHFTRSFKASVGMPPATYRAASISTSHRVRL